MRDQPAFPISRITKGVLASKPEDGMNGCFLLNCPSGRMMQVIASNGTGWEHVSASPFRGKGCPTWEEMCYVKDCFWPENEMVIQYHPAKDDYINCHPYVLHLWRPIGQEIPKPPKWMIGPKGQ